MYKIRCWLFKKLWYLTLIVAPTEVRAIAQMSVDLGIKEMEKRGIGT